MHFIIAFLILPAVLSAFYTMFFQDGLFKSTDCKNKMNAVNSSKHTRNRTDRNAGKCDTLDSRMSVFNTIADTHTNPADSSTVLIPLNDSPLPRLPNNGMACFVNSSVQMLFSSKLFTKYVTDPAYRHIEVFIIMNDIHKHMMHRSIIEEYRKLWVLLFGTKEEWTDGVVVDIDELSVKYHKHMLAKQNDASEFVHLLLSAMDKCAGLSPFVYTHAWDVHCNVHGRTFTVEHTYNSFINILPYGPVADQVSSFCKNIVYDNKYENSKEHDHTCLCVYEMMKSYYTTIPKMVFVQVERVLYEKNVLYDKSAVDIPMELHIFDTSYVLVSFIMHYGQADDGHFVCVTRKNDMWYYADNDDHYLIPDIDVFIRQNTAVYLLLYEVGNI